MSKRKAFPEQAGDLQTKRHFKECIISKLTFTGYQFYAKHRTRCSNRVSHLDLHNNQWDRHYHGLLWMRKLRLSLTSPWFHSVSGIARLCIEVNLTPKCIFITKRPVFLPHCSEHKHNFLTSWHPRTLWSGI